MTKDEFVLRACVQFILNNAFGVSYKGKIWDDSCLSVQVCDFDEGLCVFNKHEGGVFLFPDMETRAKHTTGGWLQPKNDYYIMPAEGWLPADMFKEWIYAVSGLEMGEFKHDSRVYCVVEVPT